MSKDTHQPRWEGLSKVYLHPLGNPWSSLGSSVSCLTEMTSSEAHWAVTQLSRGALLGRVDAVEEEYTPESSTGLTSPRAFCLLGNSVSPSGT